MTLAFALIGLAGVTISCSGSGGSSNTTRVVPTTTPSPTPTPIPTPSPSPTATSMYNTQGNITCTATDEAVPGYYVNIATVGGYVVGSTYDANGTGGFSYYQMAGYVTPGPSPVPTNPPLQPATPAPSETPGALGIIYYGEYTVPAFTDVGSGTPIDATDGCFTFETTQALGGTVGEARPALTSPTPSAYGQGVGWPAFAAPYPFNNAVISEPGDNGAATYDLSTFIITNLTRTTGTGSFSFVINGSSTTVTGSLTVTGSTSYPSEPIEFSSKLRRPGAVRRH
jgi:hypothetical protein